jgi:hypothetical protein
VLLLTAFLLVLVFRKVGLAELAQTLAQADLRWVAVSFLLTPMLIFTGVAKWKILLNSQGFKVSIPRLYALYMVGKFFNNFLPSNVGGDVVRGYELGKSIESGADSMASVFMERFTGLIVLIAFAIFSFLSNLKFIQDWRLTLAMGLATFGLLGVFWAILDPRPLDLFEKYVRIAIVQKYIPKLRKFHASLVAYRHNQRAIALSLAWSLVFMLLAVFNVYASASAFYQPISLLQVAIIVPIILVVSMVPLTFNGLGIQEWAYVVLFTWIGLPASVGLSTIVLIRAKELVVAISGGLLYPVVKLTAKPGPAPVENVE